VEIRIRVNPCTQNQHETEESKFRRLTSSGDKVRSEHVLATIELSTGHRVLFEENNINSGNSMKIIISIALLTLLTGWATSQQVLAKDKRIIVSHIGFYSSESAEFKPARIGYSSVINFPTWLNETGNYLESLGYQVSDTTKFESTFVNLDSETNEDVSRTVNLFLSELNNSLATGEESCVTCTSMKFISLPELSGYSNWDEEDSVVLLLGLETQSPSSEGLRSGLAAIRFNGDGVFKKYSFTPYNFTQYDTEKKIDDTKVLLNKVL